MEVGTQNLKEALSFTHAALKAGFALADGFQFMDVAEFVSVAKKMPPFLKDIAQVIPEYADLTDKEREELKAFVVADLELPDQKAEDFVEKALCFVLDLSDLAKVLHGKA